jgi:hypothetical protein
VAPREPACNHLRPGQLAHPQNRKRPAGTSAAAPNLEL